MKTQPVFISYSRKNELTAQKLAAELGTHGIKTWIDRKDLVPGALWETEIERAIKDAHAVITCLSEEAVSSTGYFQKELRIALDMEKRHPLGAIYIIPILLDGCRIPEHLSHLHAIPYQPGRSEDLELLLKALGHRREQTIAPGEAADDNETIPRDYYSIVQTIEPMMQEALDSLDTEDRDILVMGYSLWSEGFEIRSHVKFDSEADKAHRIHQARRRFSRALEAQLLKANDSLRDKEESLRAQEKMLASILEYFQNL